MFRPGLNDGESHASVLEQRSGVATGGGLMTWEYYHGSAGFKEIDSQITELGKQGWELISVMPAPFYAEVDRRTHFDRLQYFMKRVTVPIASRCEPSFPRGDATERVPVREVGGARAGHGFPPRG